MNTSLSMMPHVCFYLLVFVFVFFSHEFLKLDQNWPWHTAVIVSPVPSKVLQRPPATASLISKCLSRLSNAQPNLVRAACSQPTTEPWVCSHFMISGDHFMEMREKSTEVVIRRRWFREVKESIFFNKWDGAASGCHITQMKPNRGHF